MDTKMKIDQILTDNYLIEDLHDIVKSEMTRKLFSSQISNVLITGGTGLVGSLLVKSILEYNDKVNRNICVYAIVRNIEKARKIYGKLEYRNDLRFIEGDIVNRDWLKCVGQVDLVFHCAAVTSSKVMINKPVETIDTAIFGTKNLLDFAVQKKVKQFLYVSSMEVYGTMEDDELATEDKLGYINNLAIRSNYPESKRLCENLCVAYKSEYGLDVRIARLAQTFGAGILPWENRVFAQFARSAYEGQDLVLHTKGLSEGNYCYSKDVILGMFTILVKGNSAEAYNIVNENSHCTIYELATLVSKQITNGKSKVIIDIPKENIYGYAADTKLTLSGKKLMDLGWMPTISLEDSFVRIKYSL